MQSRILRIPSFLLVLLTCAALAMPTASHAKKKPFDRIVVFGTSLSDSGNAFVIIKNPTYYSFGGCDMGTPLNVPPYDTLDELLIPDGVYARGGHHVTNGATWIEQYARSQSLAGTTRPALRSDGTKASNYAVGGAGAYTRDCRFNLLDQLTAYTEDFPQTSAKSLVVIEMGSNDIRDILSAEPTKQAEIFVGALTNIGGAISMLYAQGARNFLVVNVPAIERTPAIKQIDSTYPGTSAATWALIKSFNQEIDTLIHGDPATSRPGLEQLPGITITTLDLNRIMNYILNHPDKFGITNIDTPCVTPDAPPYTCAKPDTYFFWDGIHPTKAIHSIVAQKVNKILTQN